MIKRLTCMLLGHKYRCIHHNLIVHERNVDSVYACLSRCYRCFGGLHYYLHYDMNCGINKENSTDDNNT